jgi:hypothetical protein
VTQLKKNFHQQKVSAGLNTIFFEKRMCGIFFLKHEQTFACGVKLRGGGARSRAKCIWTKHVR